MIFKFKKVSLSDLTNTSLKIYRAAKFTMQQLNIKTDNGKAIESFCSTVFQRTKIR